MSLQPTYKPVQYIVKCDGEVQGPFDSDFIETMILAGVYPPSVSVSKVGSSTWGAYQGGSAKKPEAILQDRESTASKALNRQPAILEKASAPACPEDVLPKRAEKWTESQKTAGGFFLGVSIFALCLSVVFMMNKSEKAETNAPFVESSKNSSPRPTAPATAVTASKAAPVPLSSQSLPPSNVSQVDANLDLSNKWKPALVAPVDDSMLYRDTSGRTYRVSNAAFTRLSAMKSVLESKSRALDPAKEEIDSADVELESKRRYLDSTNKYAVDSFNRLVDRRNAMNEQLKAKLADYNRDVATFNAELARVGTLIH